MELFYNLMKNEKFNRIYAGLNEGKIVNLTNVKSGLKGYLALFASRSNHNVLYLTATDSDAAKRAAALQRHSECEVLYYPAEVIYDYFSDARSQNIRHTRIEVIEKLLSGKNFIVVCSIESFSKKIMPPKDLQKYFLKISQAEICELEKLSCQLVSMGYVRRSQVESKGEFAIRGGILDIFNVTSSAPYRIEFFDDEVDSIRNFDVRSQRSIENLTQVTIAPTGEITLEESVRQAAIAQIKKKYTSPEYQERIENIETTGGGSDEILFTFIKESAGLLNYLKAPIVLWDEYGRVKENFSLFTEKTEDEYRQLIDSGILFAEEKNKFHTFSSIENSLNTCPTLRTFLFSTRFKKDIVIDMNSVEIDSGFGRREMVVKVVSKYLNAGYRIIVFTKNLKKQEKLMQFFLDNDLNKYGEDGSSGIYFEDGEIMEGCDMPDEKIVYFNESELFREKEQRQHRNKSKIKGKKIDAFTDLHMGDYIVHDTHGIGIYHGIKQMEIAGAIKDLMDIEYAGDARLYIPIEQMDAVQVYIGTGGEKKPKINKLGNPDWGKTKQKVKKALEDMADELIELYAKRRKLKGYAFSKDTNWQKEFEDDFPYVETDDQLKCVEEIKSDMESEIPMDRLLCGDVGYGKTEVALRGAFKAIMDGKQVAVLVPTTILAQQHYNTVRSRFAKYPITVEVMSRFKTATQQKKILEELKIGKVDILIGTHRLLSKDVHFKDLALLIIDEEQRFGVRAKEKLKRLKENVDVLTLSATPIPRTLHMSLTGVRDMSTIEEPPQGRQPVRTFVMPYNPLFIKDAIRKEINRNGQVYFVHNQIRDISSVAYQIKELVPEATIAYAHGRMEIKELEDIMVRFLEGDIDVLVTTAIIESGMDIKNANTMIVNKGDHFGLSQLYQLRGRVGRSEKQAYCYITHKREMLTEIAAKRLKAIKDFTAFGSGFKIALRDMEIRGAGNLLGSEQSGHLFSIGYELYVRILEETIKERLDGYAAKEDKPVTILLNVDNYLPDNYIPDEETKYDIYKKMTYLKNKQDFIEIEDELIDRFGDIPMGVYNLMRIALIKSMASEMEVTEIKQNGKRVFFSFDKNNNIISLSSDKISVLFKKYKVKFKAGNTNAIKWQITIPLEDDRSILDAVLDFLETLKDEKE